MNNLIAIRDFERADLERAGEIALAIWGSESELIPASMRKNLYAYLVRYYYVPESPLSCAATVNGKMCAFLLAATEKHKTGAAEQWILPRLSESEEKIFRRYKAYLDGNTEAEYRYLREKETVLHLFASVEKGCGSRLMQELLRRCRKQGIESLILWTDDTCDFEWYERNHFSRVARFVSVPSLPGRELTTLIFRRDVEKL